MFTNVYRDGMKVEARHVRKKDLDQYLPPYVWDRSKNDGAGGDGNHIVESDMNRTSSSSFIMPAGVPETMDSSLVITGMDPSGSQGQSAQGWHHSDLAGQAGSVSMAQQPAIARILGRRFSGTVLLDQRQKVDLYGATGEPSSSRSSPGIPLQEQYDKVSIPLYRLPLRRRFVATPLDVSERLLQTSS